MTGTNVLHTTDGGQIWLQQALPTLPFGSNLNQVQFLDTNNGWIVGSTAGGVRIVIHTADGGKTWDLNYILPPPEVFVGSSKAYFASSKEGWIIAAGKNPTIYKQFIYHTGNSGQTWEVEYEHESSTEPIFLSDIHYADGVAIAVGTGGVVLRNTVTPIGDTAPTLTEVKANPTTIKNGQTLTLTVTGGAGLKVWADVSALVTLSLYDMTGAVVRTIQVGHQPAAVYESRDKAIYWDGRNDFGERVASGVYFYTLTAIPHPRPLSQEERGVFTATRKMLILK
ncbi:hypothetical protein HYR99_10580 [Candidatus Poribacteria bacterium]|nr:hypothetical protein [Candidatus Poribacteria bacterium]